MNSNERRSSERTSLGRNRIRSIVTSAVVGAAALAFVVSPASGVVAGSASTAASGAASVGSASERSATTGLRGPRGPRGYRGYRGYAGAKGDPGAMGAAGPQGPAGAQGEVGPAGAKGDPGPAGKSGVVSVLSFDGTWGPATIPGNNGNTVIKPAACLTGSHLAGAGEVAVVTMDTTGSPNPSASDTLYLDAMYTMDGGAAQYVNPMSFSADSMASGVANVTMTGTLPLQEGHSYRFQAGMSSNSLVTIPNNGGYCHGSVMIVRSGG